VLLRHATTLTLIALAFAGCGGSDSSDEQGQGGFDGERAYSDVEAQVEIGPRPSGSRGSRREVALIERELERAGLREVVVQRPLRNVLATIPGAEPGTVVVGAHHDTKDAIPGFVGANDGASGVAVVLELARALPATLEGPSVQLVLFDAEEARGSRPFEVDGTRGSRQYVEYADHGEQGAALLEQIRAMVLFDMVGDCSLQVPLEANSDPALYQRFAAAAEELNGNPAPFEGTTAPIADDHAPFAEAGIPAVDLIDFTYGEGPSPGALWHTAGDTLDQVCAGSLEAVGEAAALAIPRIR
jgi:Zn-dependent M28 family amino/carboxypeptidase